MIILWIENKKIYWEKNKKNIVKLQGEIVGGIYYQTQIIVESRVHNDFTADYKSTTCTWPQKIEPGYILMPPNVVIYKSSSSIQSRDSIYKILILPIYIIQQGKNRFQNHRSRKFYGLQFLN